jgi:CRISPR-associated protein Cas2
MIVVAAYDVSHDDRRSRLAAVLQSMGDRVQRSVFVLSVTEEDLGHLTAKAMEILDHDHDSLYLFSQCHRCWEAVGCVGQAEVEPPVLYWAVLWPVSMCFL